MRMTLTSITIQLMAALTCIAGLAYAQAPATPLASNANSGPVLTAPLWIELSLRQQESLKPLALNWDRLTEGQRRKWIAVSQNFPKLSPSEQEKIHARMLEWAALKPKERERARLNFAETKKIAPADRAANWEAYQALTAEEKKELARKAPKKTPSAAVAVKPVTPDKMAMVSVTRHTPEPALEKQLIKQAIDRRTLLPVSRPPDADTIESPLTKGPNRQ